MKTLLLSLLAALPVALYQPSVGCAVDQPEAESVLGGACDKYFFKACGLVWNSDRTLYCPEAWGGSPVPRSWSDTPGRARFVTWSYCGGVATQDDRYAFCGWVNSYTGCN